MDGERDFKKSSVNSITQKARVKLCRIAQKFDDSDALRIAMKQWLGPKLGEFIALPESGRANALPERLRAHGRHVD